MQTKLTLRMENELIERAKRWAQRHGVSLSQFVASVIEQLPPPSKRNDSLSPWTRELIGAGAKKGPRSDAAVKHAYLDHQAQRHR